MANAYPMAGGIVSLRLSPTRMPEDSICKTYINTFKITIKYENANSN